MFFFPFATDAPIYHWPVVTVLLIVANTLIYFVTGGLDGVPLDSVLLLHFYHIQPVEWITNNFMHADVLHLIGNMLFLWPFGLVVEGKLGWWRFLLVYLGIGLIYGATTQVVMFCITSAGDQRVVLGASAVIFGLLALCLVWAPKNEFKVFYVMLLYFVRVGVWDVSIMVFSGVYVGWQLVMFGIGGFNVSSALLHLIGFAVAFPLGFALLKLQVVDCEGWDLLAVMSGKLHTLPDVVEQRQEVEAANEQYEEKQRRKMEQSRAAALELMQHHLREGRGAVAHAVYMKHSGPAGATWQLPDVLFAELLNAVVAEKMWPEAIRLLRRLMTDSPTPASGARLKLAEILIQVENRPRQALAVLSKLPLALTEPQSRRRDKLVRLAEQEIEEGALEMSTEDW